MDNPSESTALDVDGAAAAFAAILDPQPVSEDPDKDKAVEAEQPVEAEGEQETPEVEAETTEDDPLVTIKVNGEDIQVPLSELKNGYQRQADYTRKTMEVAEQRKAAEAEASKAQQERQQYGQNLQRMQAQLEAVLIEHQKTDWESLLQTDPTEYLRQRHLFEQRQAAWQQNLSEQQKLASQIQADEQKRFQEHLTQQRELLIAKLPEWSNPEKAKAETAEIRSYLIEQGYPEQVVDTLSDANMVITARKAMLFDRMVAKAKTAEKKVATLPTKVEKPGTGANPGLDRRTSAFQQLSKSGSIDDAARVFAGIL